MGTGVKHAARRKPDRSELQFSAAIITITEPSASVRRAIGQECAVLASELRTAGFLVSTRVCPEFTASLGLVQLYLRMFRRVGDPAGE